MTPPVLIIIGSGPQNGVSTASLFATNRFSRIALLSRSSSRLAVDREAVLTYAKAHGKEVEVKTWSVDITKTETFKGVLGEVDVWANGGVECVVFNAAKVEPTELLKYDEKEFTEEFLTTTIALYTSAQHFVPILSKVPTSSNPSFLVTSSFLWRDPYPVFFSLSVVKAAQRNLVQSLALTYPDIHFATLNCAGPVGKQEGFIEPDAVAPKFWELYSQKKEEWTFDLPVYTMWKEKK